ncbi:hypothetical protein BOTBODRAFT_53828 [Botryobasidium botryosum FD-172 SS1]|uniref:VWFA domain-containing protein n=1 Tax=Botryobasidium botryosum (strain FD-172 SS1) TaxID=930990 RepID=A0A067MPV9_BOTB1|nr:hypothetical protein BOTBODRAFT_53828 [Botryobasidium botryosum FD-172 SS1]
MTPVNPADSDTSATLPVTAPPELESSPRTGQPTQENSSTSHPDGPSPDQLPSQKASSDTIIDAGAGQPPFDSSPVMTQTNDKNALPGTAINPNQVAPALVPDSDDLSASSSLPGATSDLQPSLTSSGVDQDLLGRTKGMYRLLELYREQGNGGLVDKILISQSSIKALINHVSPGAYASMTKIDFAALDQMNIKPLGIYGSKSEIVKLLEETDVVDGQTANLLLAPADPSDLNHPTLKPGLYAILASPSSIEPEKQHIRPAYIVFWPEEATWADDVIPTVQRNRVTFMRYLSKITDQLLALMSPEDAQAIVWSDGPDDFEAEEDMPDPDRFYTFEVSKTKDQQEDVKMSTGFMIGCRDIRSPTGDGLPAEFTGLRLQPRLVAGETRSGYLIAAFKPELASEEERSETFNPVRLRSMLSNPGHGISLDKSISRDGLRILIDHGLRARCQSVVSAWENRDQDYNIRNYRDLTGRKEALRAESDPTLDGHLKQVIALEVLKIYPSLRKELLVEGEKLPTVKDTNAYLKRLVQLYPRVANEFNKHRDRAHADRLTDDKYKTIKKRFLVIWEVVNAGGAGMGRERQEELARLILTRDKLAHVLKGLNPHPDPSPSNFVKSALTRAVSTVLSSIGLLELAEDQVQAAMSEAAKCPDSVFIANLFAIQETEPIFGDAVAELLRLVHAEVKARARAAFRKLHSAITAIQQEDRMRQCEEEARLRLQKLLQDSFQTFAKTLEDATAAARSQLCFRIKHVTRARGPGPEYVLDILEKRNIPAQVEYKLNVFDLTQRDTQELSSNHLYVPHPEVRSNAKFRLTPKCSLRYIQLLDKNKCLLLIDDLQAGFSRIYLDDLAHIDSALHRNGAGTRIFHDRVGKDFLFSVNESKGLVSIFSTTQSKYQLHIYAFNDTLTGVRARGSAIDLTAHYSEKPTINRICFVNGSEEIMLLEESGVARIYSMVTLQFRPARLTLKHTPERVLSTPDGSCLILVETYESNLTLRAFHWASFGSNAKEHVFSLKGHGATSFSITSYAHRSCVHFLCLCPESQKCWSYALDITKKVSEFSFRANGNGEGGQSNLDKAARNNCLIDCHADVWSRFPVVAAIKRSTLTSAGRCPPSIVFATDRDHDQYTRYFDNLIRAFERTKRKPTNHLLDDIQIHASPLLSLKTHGLHSGVSVFKFGEWFVELFCLIPIHIAITSSNRFIPLKDGVYSSDYERSLLGADVGKIIESLSFGWYESIFRSYMATTPVKVVTSMGEQSVGKSYALNHLVDTSFAGSAMRCTEGVWLSLTPTREALVVAIDFEGVQSIERSAQEDTLLVLFNAAISNLVLFRNNFVFSRDIAGLFASFQSSSSVLDPASNPTLFQSTLAIIIRDVTDSDKIEIVKEFQLKFQKIVHEEQEQNFITRMHSGRLDIIPWPLLDSPRFYSSFGFLRSRLERQPSTHGPAGVFLQTLKTLMAKIKVCDWGSLDQNLASHRAQQLLSVLPAALSYGSTTADPDLEPLKDMDTDKALPSDDSNAVFYIRNPEIPLDEEARMKAQFLSKLRESWSFHAPMRQTMPDTDWIKQLALHLQVLTQERIQHVRNWITTNISRFSEDNAEIRNLQRAFQDGIVEIQGNIELCGSVCAFCSLLCVQGKQHEDSHDCGTSHNCVQNCEFDHDEELLYSCCLGAGHAGRHSCDTSSHSCGQICDLHDAGGCMQTCSLPADHLGDEHRCSARLHTCNRPCDLNDPQKSLLCEGHCVTEWDEPHTQHVCEDKLSCPIQCQLCKRLCAQRDHLHGLVSGSVHLCGQKHSCIEICEMPGVCDIATSPQSIESTFTGRHEVFQYTKFTQVARQLPCVIPIEPDEISHTGPHVHSTDPKVFHFCEERCPSCSYFCTLPLDHTQLEHETSHGSMSQTTWSIDGSDDTAVEVQGHKYAAGDSGAPMLCSLFCRDMGRHAHISPCRSSGSGVCSQPEVEHIDTPMAPDPDMPKDWISHRLFWARSDPYSSNEQTEFSK